MNKIVLAVILLILNTATIKADSNGVRVLFSPRYVNNMAYDFIINDNRVIVRKRDDGIPDRNLIQMTTKEETATYIPPQPYDPKAKDSCETENKKKGKITKIQDKDVCVEIPEPPRIDTYKYQLAPDGCYELENGFIGCFSDGKLIKVERNFNKYYMQKVDSFFFENSMRCKLFKFDLIDRIFIKKDSFRFKEYQLLYNGYPDLIKIIIIEDDETLLPKIDKQIYSTNSVAQVKIILSNIDASQKIAKLNGKKRLRAFYLSSRNEIGCLDKKFNILKKAQLEEENNDYMYNNSYPDLKQWDKSIDSIDDIAIILQEDIVLYVNKEIYDLQ